MTFADHISERRESRDRKEYSTAGTKTTGHKFRLLDEKIKCYFLPLSCCPLRFCVFVSRLERSV